MLFHFDITLNDDDYLAYNRFHMIRSPYGAKTLRNFRLVLTAIVALFLIPTLSRTGFSPYSLIAIIPSLAILTVMQLLLPTVLVSSVKSQIKKAKKTGKPAYSPKAEIEFYEDFFVETTDENRSEIKYSAIERISVVDGKYIYIHVNSVMSYIVHVSLLDTAEKYDAFMAFLATKCDKIKEYTPKR